MIKCEIEILPYFGDHIHHAKAGKQVFLERKLFVQGSHEKNVYFWAWPESGGVRGKALNRYPKIDLIR